MAKIHFSLITHLPGLEVLHEGKVRVSYALPGYPKLMLVVVTDRVSVYDFVLKGSIPAKGEVLNALNIYWKVQTLPGLLGAGFQHDIFAYGAAIDKFLPIHLRGNPELHKRATVVMRMPMDSIEHVVRGYLTGGGWKTYRETNPHVLCGHTLPDGLFDGAKFAESLYTPTTKEDVGHDLAMDVSLARERFPGAEDYALRVYEAARKHALRQRIIIADTKFETGRNLPERGTFFLCDEALTPDSSRFWAEDAWNEFQAQRKSPPSWDKQLVRNWASGVGIALRKPEVDADVEWVWQQQMPLDLVGDTVATYFAIFKRLTTLTLSEFQGRHLLAA